jgi:phosphatidylserine/phosphatidylglycerophosphate/cardiolipin synthase-like enzyme
MFWYCVLFCQSIVAAEEKFSNNAAYNVCFTPGQNCTKTLIDYINREKNSIFVQAYSFTSSPIAAALIAAKKRGVQVKVILDKSQVNREKYSASKFLDNQGIPVWIDSKPAIAHNKIFIFSDRIATGSFNFTKAAQERNAENIIFIRDRGLTDRYRKNWFSRQKTSTPLRKYKSRK